MRSFLTPYLQIETMQAESFEEAKKLAEAYVQDASLDTTDYPEIVQDVLEVAEYGIIDVEQ